MYVGVDAGGTRSRLLIVNRKGKTITASEGDPINLFRCPARKAMVIISELLDSALSAVENGIVPE